MHGPDDTSASSTRGRRRSGGDPARPGPIDARGRSGSTVVAHAVAGSAGTRLAELIARRAGLAGGRTFAPIVAGVSSVPAALGASAPPLPEGPGLAEAIVARARTAGVPIEWGAPVVVASFSELAKLARERGESSVALVRADPSLLSELQLGTWFAGRPRLRAARRAGLLAPRSTELVWWSGVRGLELALEVAFWDGVRRVASERELRRLSRSSYVALYFHRIASATDQPRLAVPPERFRRQLRVLRALRFHPLGPEEQLRFHSQPDAVLPRRSYVLTADDGFLDAARALAAAAAHRPQLFVPTALAGGSAPWAGGAPLAGWDELRATAAAGVAIGSHTRTHRALPDTAQANLSDELDGSLADLSERLEDPLHMLAYPHGRHDQRAARAAGAAGFQAAYTTDPGRNGAGTEPLRLARIGVKAWDGPLELLWKATTGAHLPRPWERIRLSLHGRRVKGAERGRDGGG